MSTTSFSPLRPTLPTKSTNSLPLTQSSAMDTAPRMDSNSNKMKNGEPKVKAISYEAFAPRSASVRSKLAKIQELTLGPVHFSIVSNQDNGNVSGVGSNSMSMQAEKSIYLEAMLPPAMLREEQSETESLEQRDAHIQSTLARATQTCNHITHILTNTATLHKVLLQTTTLAQSIADRHESLLQHSSELSLSAERLQNESSQLERHAMEIGLPLKHYDAVDRLGLQVGILFKNGNIVRGLSSVKVDDEAFLGILDDVDAAVQFFAERNEVNAGVLQDSSSSSQQVSSGSAEYYKRSLALHEACMDLFKEAIVDRIVHTSLQIYGALDLKKKSVSGDTLEASLIYTRFHGISSRSRYLLNIIKKRMGNKVDVPVIRSRKISSRNRNEMVCPYTELWNMCRNTYIQNRSNLLNTSVRNHLDLLKDKHGLVGMTRLASVFLMRLCTAETVLYLDFFGNDTRGNGDSEGNSESVAATATVNVEEKEEKENVNIDTNESDDAGATNQVYGGSVSTKSKAYTAALATQVMAKDGTYYDADFQSFLDGLCNNLHRTIRRSLISMIDLDTLCQIVSVLREERSLANASPLTMAVARSLGRVIVDAQERLIFCANGMLSKEVVKYKATPMDLDYPDRLRRAKEQKEEKKDKNVSTAVDKTNNSSIEDDALKRQLEIYESWFPPIRSVLKVLSKIFRVVEPKVFEDIALSGVQSCAKSLKEGSLYIETKSGQLHSDLFLVKHLLILREQLSPFDMQLRSVERQLDFSDAGKAVSRFLANRNRRLFSMTTENALVTLLREGLHTREASIDSKRDLENALRSACNAFIEHTSASLASPIITFVDQYKSVTSNDASIYSQSFLSSDCVKAVFTRTLDRLEPQLGEVLTQMSLYMENSTTRGILLKPVLKKVTRVLEESKKIVALCDAEENSSWGGNMKEEVLKVIEDIEFLLKKTTPSVN